LQDICKITSIVVKSPDQDVSHAAVSSQQYNYDEVNGAGFITTSEKIIINNQTDIPSSQTFSRQQIYASTSQNQTRKRRRTESRDQTDLKEALTGYHKDRAIEKNIYKPSDDQHDPEWYFLQSLLPHLNKVSDDSKLEWQMASNQNEKCTVGISRVKKPRIKKFQPPSLNNKENLVFAWVALKINVAV
jgi:hypothetical protein